MPLVAPAPVRGVDVGASVTRSDDATVDRLVVAAETREALAAAVTKAAMIEHYTGAAITALLAFYDPIADEPAEWFSQDDSRRIVDGIIQNETRALEAALAPWREHVADLECEVHFERDSAAAITRVARGKKADLVLKAIAPSHRIADFFHAPPDWELMRSAPCPVLFTRPRAWQKPVRVLAAVDAMDVQHESLNREIVRRAALLRAILDGELHVVSAYPSLTHPMNQYPVAADIGAIQSDMRERRRIAMTKLLANLRVTATGIHVIEGRPRIVIRELATRLDAGITVLGTAARTGIEKLLIGNTAEGIVSDLGTDLLTVRAPEQYEQR